MGVIKEFKEFSLKGNVVDMAVGIILGAAFGTVVNSFVNDILSPPLGFLLGDRDLSELFWVLDGGSYTTVAAARADGAIVVAYGAFLQAVISFLLVALALFLFVRTMNRLRREDEAEPQLPTKRACPYCRSQIALDASRCPSCTSEVEVGSGP